ncbi:uncharacterized protein I303_103747 [Kwoniella dejecticola CBS 10117]|uniref:B2-aldehyde-forming enzyme n=1 Tax=Kwoniella dejecticola CBS 10117 TaxID=1296121 RepID=A0A1A6A7L3_9TREE|nr:uncharacterized protein I303_03764 [Kwoniella dejecticola CBS 10117]OBR86046.1 hypothetical protein I303_03764 [Kwoniella dejecticola CBS 10117]
MLSSLFSLLLLSTSVLGFSDRNTHELSRSRARAHYAKKAVYSFEASFNETAPETRSVEKRGQQYANSRATFYDVGLGACGWYNNANDFIVAQNSAQYGGGYPGPNCGRSISISYGGKVVTATIADECPTCPYGGLDMSRGLFDQFASESAGVFYMTWWYNDESQDPTTTSEKPSPTSTYTPPTSTWVEPSTTPTPTSTWVEPSTTSTAHSTSSEAAAQPSSSVSTTASSSASLGASSSGIPDTVLQTNATIPLSANATGTLSSENSETTAPVAALGNLVLFNQAVAYLGHIVVVGAEN